MQPSVTSAGGSKDINDGYNYIRNFIARDACIASACDTSIYIGNSYVNSVSAIKCSWIHLQFFWNLEMKGAELKIRVVASYASIESTCLVQNMKVESTGLKIQVGTSLLGKDTKVCYIYERRKEES